MSIRTRLAFAAIAVAFLCGSRAEAATCESLSSVSLPNTTVTMAQTVAPGAFTQPGRAGRAGGANPFAALPSFCRVALTMKPTPQSNIKAEVWLPSAGWNGKLQVVGNGAWARSISYPAMATALAAGYVAASTDTGHAGGSEAQRYPDDFDGIIAGDAAIHGLTLALGQIWFSQAMTKNPASAIPREELAMIHKAVLAACDGSDGAMDGVLENPTACRFDPKVLACTAGSDGADCLTSAQVGAAQKIYAGAKNSRTGAAVFPGLEVGSEAAWSPTPVGYAVDLFKYVVFKDRKPGSQHS